MSNLRKFVCWARSIWFRQESMTENTGAGRECRIFGGTRFFGSNDPPEGDVMFARCIVTTFGMLALAMSMHAQDLVRVSVPFDFTVGGQSLPHSTYEISRVETTSLEMLSVRNLDNQSQTELVLAKTNETLGEPKLLFDRYGGKYF